jgi:hypothetical protein
MEELVSRKSIAWETEDGNSKGRAMLLKGAAHGRPLRRRIRVGAVGVCRPRNKRETIPKEKNRKYWYHEHHAACVWLYFNSIVLLLLIQEIL